MKKLLILVASLTILALSLSQAAAAPNPLVIAHRGSSAQAPENTLPAFQLAWEQGADGIEADFLLTKDGQIVCFHDNDPKLAAAYRAQGADAIITDVPAEMLAALLAPADQD